MKKDQKYFNVIPGGLVTFDCPGCGWHHTLNDTWKIEWAGGKPSVTPSVLTKWGGNKENLCHLFVKEGMIQYLEDCTHEMAGKTIKMKMTNDAKLQTLAFSYSILFSAYLKVKRSHDKQHKEFALPVYKEHLENIKEIIHEIDKTVVFEDID
jgi:hypothetical protein